MIEPKFTPGPWCISDNASGFEIESACGKQVAQASQTCPVRQASDHDERRANARLIAAAPDLYEVARLAANINPYGNVENAAVRDLAITALAKAIIEEELSCREKPYAYLWTNGKTKLWLDDPTWPAGIGSDLPIIPVYRHPKPNAELADYGPELLDALESLLFYVAPAEDWESDQEIVKARHVIARARGE
jgi:hypothetical protein